MKGPARRPLLDRIADGQRFRARDGEYREQTVAEIIGRFVGYRRRFVVGRNPAFVRVP